MNNRNAISRRQFLALSAAAASASFVPARIHARAAPRAEVLETKIISLDAAHYHGWPTVARRASGQLLVVYSGGREQHVCPFGRVDLDASNDGGRTWSMPHPIGVWGLPSHLLRLRNGRILMTYGYRRAPCGNQARLSEDEGRAWSEPLVLSSDGASGDLGYPSTVEMADGSLLTVWYETLAGNSMAVLRQATWRLEAGEAL